MRRTIVAGALCAAGLALSTTTPVNAVPTGGTGPVGATAPELGHGTAHGTFTFPVEAGKNVVARTYSVNPGEVIDWGSTPSSVMAVVKSGSLTNYQTCASSEPWKAGEVHFLARSEALGTLEGVTKNESDSPAEVLAVVSDVAGTPTAHSAGHGSSGHGESGHDQSSARGPVQAAAAGGCPTGAPAKVSENGAGLSTGPGNFTQNEGLQVGVYTFTLSPGYTSDWHTHPDVNLVIQTKGTLENWQNCKDKEIWDPGFTYFHAPGHESVGGHQNLTNNKTDKPAELVAVLFNIPAEFPAQFPPVFKAPPPADCPSATLTY